jgi:hypothetical protein
MHGHPAIVGIEYPDQRHARCLIHRYLFVDLFDRVIGRENFDG